MEIKSSDDFYLFRRLDEIDGEQQDFHISAHKCDLLYKDQNSLKAELQRRGCIRMEANSVLSDKHGNPIMVKSVQLEFMLDSIL